MSSSNWKGEHAKCKSTQEAKAILRHDDKDLRDQHEHSNPHINPEETYRNQSYYGLSYKERCRQLDQLVAEGLSKRTKKVATGKNAPTLQQNVIVTEPKEMQNMPDEVATRWFNRVGDIAAEQFEGFIDADFHYDEIHGYTNAETKEREISRRHGHYHFVPLVDGKLDGKSFSARWRIVEFNNAIQKMTQEEFGMKFMDGSKKKGTKTVPELKAASEEAEIEMLADAGYAEKISTLEDEKGEAAFQMHQAEEKMRDADQKQRKSDKMLKKATIKYRWLKVKELDGREEALDEREREQDTKEEEQRARDAALNAREAQIRAREEKLEKDTEKVSALQEKYADEFTTLLQTSDAGKKELDKLVHDPKSSEIFKIAWNIFLKRKDGQISHYRDVGRELAAEFSTIDQNERRKQAEIQLGT